MVLIGLGQGIFPFSKFNEVSIWMGRFHSISCMSCILILAREHCNVSGGSQSVLLVFAPLEIFKNARSWFLFSLRFATSKVTLS